MVRNIKKSQAEQSGKFEQTAREIGCDENADVDDVMRKLAAKRPATHKPKKDQSPTSND